MKRFKRWILFLVLLVVILAASTVAHSYEVISGKLLLWVFTGMLIVLGLSFIWCLGIWQRGNIEIEQMLNEPSQKTENDESQPAG